jgi:hypothetical protein
MSRHHSFITSPCHNSNALVEEQQQYIVMTTTAIVISDAAADKLKKERAATSLWLRGDDNLTSKFSSSPRFLSFSTFITNLLSTSISVVPIIDIICCYTIHRRSSRILVLGRDKSNDDDNYATTRAFACAFTPFPQSDSDVDLPPNGRSWQFIPLMRLPYERIIPVRINNRYLLACTPQTIWMFDMMLMKWYHIPFFDAMIDTTLMDRSIKSGIGWSPTLSDRWCSYSNPSSFMYML